MNKSILSLFMIMSLTFLVTCKGGHRFLSDTNEVKACSMLQYGRGIGKLLSSCPQGTQQDGALCYPPCKDGYYGVGPVCWQSCPSGFTDTGVDCLKPSSYGRGVGYALWHKSECEKENPQGCEKNGALYYPKCKEGFHNVGCCICSPNCPSGWTDIGVSCEKGSYGRGAGVPLVCAGDEEQSGALCYPQCKAGYNGSGPICEASRCPPAMSLCGGAMCVENPHDCNAYGAYQPQDGSDTSNIPACYP